MFCCCFKKYLEKCFCCRNKNKNDSSCYNALSESQKPQSYKTVYKNGKYYVFLLDESCNYVEI